MTHELKLLLLLSDQASSVSKRDSEVRAVREEVERKRGQVGAEIVKVFGGTTGSARNEDDEMAQGDGNGIAPPDRALQSAPGEEAKGMDEEDEEMEEV